ncbi:MAG TPA: c-type cytochrome [Chitinophagaceae bacterium]|nr:c-type cytochrome [Chitinophagaceae bacterium]
MKKCILSLALLALLAACGGGSGENKSQSGAADVSKDPVYQKGLELVGKNDCLTCHKIDDVFTGPSYKQIAEKYAGASDAMITELGQKIIKGGNGVWGSALMTPHPAISQQDAEAMVKYILLLKK